MNQVRAHLRNGSCGRMNDKKDENDKDKKKGTAPMPMPMPIPK
jgi:hypothetical protein